MMVGIEHIECGAGESGSRDDYEIESMLSPKEAREAGRFRGAYGAPSQAELYHRSLRLDSHILHTRGRPCTSEPPTPSVSIFGCLGCLIFLCWGLAIGHVVRPKSERHVGSLLVVISRRAMAGTSSSGGTLLWFGRDREITVAGELANSGSGCLTKSLYGG
jgi:hypothetical protein